MNPLKASTVPAVFAAGLFVLSPQTADAQVHFFSRSGKDSVFAAGLHGYGKYDQPSASALRVRNRAALPVDHFVRPPVEDGRVWRETSTYEFRPSAVIRHGDHYDVIPGHYEYRSTGRWDEPQVRPGFPAQ